MERRGEDHAAVEIERVLPEHQREHRVVDLER